MSEDTPQRRLDALRQVCQTTSAPRWLFEECRRGMDMTIENEPEAMVSALTDAMNVLAVRVSRTWPMTPNDLRIAVLLSEAARIAGGE